MTDMISAPAVERLNAEPLNAERVNEDTAGFVVRNLTDSDWPEIKAVDAAAFGYVPDDDFLDKVALPTYDLTRFTGVFDPGLDGLMVGIGAIQSRELTFPGAGPAPVAAVTWVAVRPDQQRRGVLRQVMRHQLHGLHTAGSERVDAEPAEHQPGDPRASNAIGSEPIAILTASESSIYGRFGYGLAMRKARLEVPAPTALAGFVSTEPVMERPLAEALPLMKVIHAAARPTSPGYLDRSDAIWSNLLSEHPFVQQRRGPRRFALHADGYVIFRLTESWTDRGPDYTLTVVEICASTPVARASLWRHVLAYPLVKKVVVPLASMDEPLQDMLDNPRAMSCDVGDHVWVRLVDLPRAVGLRTYSAPASVIVEVADSFCPWNVGTWRLDLDTAGGTASRTTQTADVRLDIRDLGAAFLGGTRLARLALAQRVTGSARSIAELDAAMATPLQPFTPEGF